MEKKGQRTIFSKIGTSEGVRNKSPQNVPVWRVDYFELKAIKAQQTQEELYSTPSTASVSFGGRQQPYSEAGFCLCRRFAAGILQAASTQPRVSSQATQRNTAFQTDVGQINLTTDPGQGNRDQEKPNIFWCSEEKTKITHHRLDHTLKSVPRTVKLSDSEECGIIYKTALPTSPL